MLALRINGKIEPLPEGLDAAIDALIRDARDWGLATAGGRPYSDLASIGQARVQATLHEVLLPALASYVETRSGLLAGADVDLDSLTNRIGGAVRALVEEWNAEHARKWEVR